MIIETRSRIRGTMHTFILHSLNRNFFFFSSSFSFRLIDSFNFTITFDHRTETLWTFDQTQIKTQTNNWNNKRCLGTEIEHKKKIPAFKLKSKIFVFLLLFFQTNQSLTSIFIPAISIKIPSMKRLFSSFALFCCFYYLLLLLWFY